MPGAPSAWGSDRLERIGQAEELQLASLGADAHKVAVRLVPLGRCAITESRVGCPDALRRAGQGLLSRSVWCRGFASAEAPWPRLRCHPLAYRAR